MNSNIRIVPSADGVKSSLVIAKPDQKFQFERFGYFVADRVDHVTRTKPVFNPVAGVKDSWGK